MNFPKVRPATGEDILDTYGEVKTTGNRNRLEDDVPQVQGGAHVTAQ